MFIVTALILYMYRELTVTQHKSLRNNVYRIIEEMEEYVSMFNKHRLVDCGMEELWRVG